MQIVLVKKVKTLGNPGDIREVARGYATNFLIPQGIAMPATEGNIKEAKSRARKYEKSSVVDDSLMADFIKEVDGLELTIKGKANEKGGLFSAIHEGDIAEGIAKKISKSIDSDYIVLKDPIKKIGEYDVEIKAGENVGKIKLKVEAEA